MVRGPNDWEVMNSVTRISRTTAKRQKAPAERQAPEVPGKTGSVRKQELCAAAAKLFLKVGYDRAEDRDDHE